MRRWRASVSRHRAAEGELCLPKSPPEHQIAARLKRHTENRATYQVTSEDFKPSPRSWGRKGSGGVPIPGGVPEPWGCGTEGRGQWAWWGWAGVGLVDLSGLFTFLPKGKIQTVSILQAPTKQGKLSHAVRLRARPASLSSGRSGFAPTQPKSCSLVPAICSACVTIYSTSGEVITGWCFFPPPALLMSRAILGPSPTRCPWAQTSHHSSLML